MPELRQNFMTKEWVVIATRARQASRPDGREARAQAARLVFSKLSVLPGQRKLDPA